jgi:hypothetical protein
MVSEFGEGMSLVGRLFRKLIVSMDIETDCVEQIPKLLSHLVTHDYKHREGSMSKNSDYIAFEEII